MVEAKCIDIDERRSATAQEDQLKEERRKIGWWQSQIARQLRAEASLLASQHPLASPALSRLVGNEINKGAPNLELLDPLMNQATKLVGWTMC